MAAAVAATSARSAASNAASSISSSRSSAAIAAAVEDEYSSRAVADGSADAMRRERPLPKEEELAPLADEPGVLGAVSTVNPRVFGGRASCAADAAFANGGVGGGRGERGAWPPPPPSRERWLSRRLPRSPRPVLPPPLLLVPWLLVGVLSRGGRVSRFPLCEDS